MRPETVCAVRHAAALILALCVVVTGVQAHETDKLVAQGCTDIGLVPDPTAAIEPCTRLIEGGTLEDDRLAAALRHRGDAYYRTERYHDAFEAYTEALALRPDYPRALWNRANLYRRHGYRLRAMGDLNLALTVDPGYARAHELYGIIHSDTGDWRRAVEYYSKAIELDPTMYRVALNRARANALLGENGRALEDLDRVLAIDREVINRDFIFRDDSEMDLYGKLLVQRALTLIKMHRYEDAERDYDMAVRLYPDLAVSYGSRGYLWIMTDQPQRAIADLTKAIEIAPADAGHHRLRGRGHMKLAQFSKAIEDFTVAVQLDPDDAESYLFRASTFKKLRNTELALADYERAFALGGYLLKNMLSALRHKGYYSGPDQTFVNQEIRNGITACVVDPTC